VITGSIDPIWVRPLASLRRKGIASVVVSLEPVAFRGTDRGLEARTGAPPERFPKRTEVHARPFAGLGFKAYMSPRSYFRTDLKFVIDGGVEEVMMRFGIGVDF